MNMGYFGAHRVQVQIQNIGANANMRTNINFFSNRIYEDEYYSTLLKSISLSYLNVTIKNLIKRLKNYYYKKDKKKPRAIINHNIFIHLNNIIDNFFNIYFKIGVFKISNFNLFPYRNQKQVSICYQCQVTT